MIVKFYNCPFWGLQIADEVFSYLNTKDKTWQQNKLRTTVDIVSIKKRCPVSTVAQIGGTEEYKICDAIKQGRISKPVVCWCIGTCATMFSSEVRGQDLLSH